MIINCGPFQTKINKLPKHTQAQLETLYRDSLGTSEQFVDYQINLNSSGLRRFIKPQISIEIEGQQPFNPVSPAKLLPSIEWAMNWCIAAYQHNYLLFHASVVEKNGQTILFPAQSGSGKSTLATYLSCKDWHLFYDEMAVIELLSTKAMPIYRPSSLKNESINIIKSAFDSLNISDTTHGTHKGSIAHVMPHTRQQFDSFKPTKPSAVVFLNYKSGHATSIVEYDKAVGMSTMLLNAFNYSVIGEPAFETLVNIANRVRFFEITYSDMEQVDEFLTEFVEGTFKDE